MVWPFKLLNVRSLKRILLASFDMKRTSCAVISFIKCFEINTYTKTLAQGFWSIHSVLHSSYARLFISLWDQDSPKHLNTIFFIFLYARPTCFIVVRTFLFRTFSIRQQQQKRGEGKRITETITINSVKMYLWSLNLIHNENQTNQTNPLGDKKKKRREDRLPNIYLREWCCCSHLAYLSYLFRFYIL